MLRKTATSADLSPEMAIVDDELKEFCRELAGKNAKASARQKAKTLELTSTDMPPYMFWPHSPMRQFVGGVVYAATFFYLVVAPLRIFFTLNGKNADNDFLNGRNGWHVFDALMDALFIVFIGVEANTATRVMIPLRLETRRKRICKMYVSSRFFIGDLICAIPTSLFPRTPAFSIVYLLKFGRVLRLGKFRAYLDRTVRSAWGAGGRRARCARVCARACVCVCRVLSPGPLAVMSGTMAKPMCMTNSTRGNIARQEFRSHVLCAFVAVPAQSYLRFRPGVLGRRFRPVLSACHIARLLPPGCLAVICLPAFLSTSHNLSSLSTLPPPLQPSTFPDAPHPTADHTSHALSPLAFHPFPTRFSFNFPLVSYHSLHLFAGLRWGFTRSTCLLGYAGLRWASLA